MEQRELGTARAADELCGCATILFPSVIYVEAGTPSLTLPHAKKWGRGETNDGTTYRLSTLYHCEWPQFDDPFCYASGLHHFDYFGDILVGLGHFLGDAAPAMRPHSHTQSL
jgi:hypothetical protein